MASGIPRECKRLAEVDFPIAEVSKHAVSESSRTLRNGAVGFCKLSAQGPGVLREGHGGSLPEGPPAFVGRGSRHRRVRSQDDGGLGGVALRDDPGRLDRHCVVAAHDRDGLPSARPGLRRSRDLHPPGLPPSTRGRAGLRLGRGAPRAARLRRRLDGASAGRWHSRRGPGVRLHRARSGGLQPLLAGRGGSRSYADGQEARTAPEEGATTLDRVHTAMLLQARGRTHALRSLAAAERERGPDFERLANALSALYPRGSEEKRLLDAMLLAAPR